MRKSIHISKENHKQLKIYCAEKDMSIEELLNNIVAEFLTEQSRKENKTNKVVLNYYGEEHELTEQRGK